MAAMVMALCSTAAITPGNVVKLKSTDLVSAPKIPSLERMSSRAGSSKWEACFMTTGQGYAIGAQVACDVKAALVFPEWISRQCVGSKITAIEFFMGNGNSTEGDVFIRKGLEGAEICKQNVELKLGAYSAKDGISFGDNIVEFNEPYVFTGEEVAVGYSFHCPASTQANPYYPIALGYENALNDYCDNLGVIEKGVEEWANFGMPLTIIVTVEGDNLPVWLSGASSTVDAAIKPGQASSMELELVNFGGVAATDIDVATGVNGVNGEAENVKVSIGASRVGYATVQSPAIDKEGSWTVTAAVTKANGLDQAPIEFSDVVKVVANGFHRRVVAEEWTGTWCGYCPGGIWGMEYMRENYPDDFIGIAVHWGSGLNYPDAFKCNNYITLLEDAGFCDRNFPGSVIDRRVVVEPFPDTFEEMVLSSGGDTGFADVALKVAYADDAKKKLALTATTKISYDPAEVNEELAAAKYALCFVVIENGLDGTQRNYYAGSSYDVGGWESLPSSAPWTFNDVARSVDGFAGIAGSVPEVMEKGKEYDFDYTLTLPTSIKKLENVEVVALLLNTGNGTIENAVKAKTPDGVAGVDNVAAVDAAVKVVAVAGGVAVAGDCAEAEVYSLNGMKVASISGAGAVSLPAGLYVVRAVATTGETVVSKVAVK